MNGMDKADDVSLGKYHTITTLPLLPAQASNGLKIASLDMTTMDIDC
jgi:hypothetical protein